MPPMCANGTLASEAVHIGRDELRGLIQMGMKECEKPYNHYECRKSPAIVLFHRALFVCMNDNLFKRFSPQRIENYHFISCKKIRNMAIKMAEFYRVMTPWNKIILACH